VDVGPGLGQMKSCGATGKAATNYYDISDHVSFEGRRIDGFAASMTPKIELLLHGYARQVAESFRKYLTQS
jgi:hypothetical protein